MEPTKADREAAVEFAKKFDYPLGRTCQDDVESAYLAGVMAERARCVSICVKREEELEFTGDWAIDAIIETIRDGVETTPPG